MCLLFHPIEGRGLSKIILHKAMEEAAKRGLDMGLLFCVPELERIYARADWRTSTVRKVICRNETGEKTAIPGKNITMFFPLNALKLEHELDLQGRDW